MIHPSLASAVFLSTVLATLPAQQSGNQNRDYTINGFGAGQPSLVQSSAVAGGSVANSYATLDSNAPVAWVASSAANVGWYVSPWNSVDIGPTPLLVLGNGAQPGHPFASFFRTNGAGTLAFPTPVPASLASQAWYFAMSHLAASSPEGFWVSQTHLVSFSPDPNLGTSSPAPNPAAQNLTLTDDSFAAVTLGFPFTFYGTARTSGFVGSNGYLTFGTGDSSFTESVASFTAGAARIAAWWDDLNPGSGGTVRWYTDGAGSAEASWNAVPEFVSTGANSFKITLVAGVFIAFDYGTMSALDGLAGLSPGGSLAAAQALNLSAAPSQIGPGVTAPYEIFTGAPPNDLAGYQVVFLLDGSGNPTAQF